MSIAKLTCVRCEKDLCPVRGYRFVAQHSNVVFAPPFGGAIIFVLLGFYKAVAPDGAYCMIKAYDLCKVNHLTV